MWIVFTQLRLNYGSERFFKISQVAHFICVIVLCQNNNTGFLKFFEEFKLFSVCLCSGPLPSLFACNLSSLTRFIEVFCERIIGAQ